MPFLTILEITFDIIIVDNSFADYATGFGGKYGVQKDRVDQVKI